MLKPTKLSENSASYTYECMTIFILLSVIKINKCIKLLKYTYIPCTEIKGI